MEDEPSSTAHLRKMKSSNRRRPKKKKTIEEVFKAINRDHVQIKDKDRKCSNDILKGVLTVLLKKMSTVDELFCSMKPRIGHLGSYYDGLRVGKPTEYDLNVILKIPVNYEKIILDASAPTVTNDYTNIFMPSEFRRLATTPETVNKGFSETLMWCDKKHRLSVTKFQSWMQGVVDAALDSLDGKSITVNKKTYKLSSKISGPANTISSAPEPVNNINGAESNEPTDTAPETQGLTLLGQHSLDDVIDIDLVPTFEFKLSKKPKGTTVLFDKVESVHGENSKVVKTYYLVPKPVIKNKETSEKSTEDDFNWRISFPNQERLYMKGKNNFKSTLKLIKLLRDKQGFKALASYFIKTLFLWEIELRNDYFWEKKSLSYLVIHMMKQLRDSLKKGEIRNFWCPESNLINKEKITEKTCSNWSNRLTSIINEIEENQEVNPKVVLKYFTNNNPIQIKQSK